jgi:single-stranded-DNA-specific exonuclease
VEQQWTIKAADDAAIQQVLETCGLSFPVARTLVARGIDTPQKVRVFLEPSLERDWADPANIFGMTAVTDALEAAIRAGKHILVFGDFDVDGISSTALMLRALVALGAQQTSHLIPNRMDDGYGLTQKALDRVCALAPDVVVTVDCGISAGTEVAQLLAQGIDVIVTDHHEPSDAVPQGIPLTNPRLGPGSPSSALAGVGVALKLVQALGARFGKPQLWRDFTDLATLGTVADLMPLRGENRALVKDGLLCINTMPRPGIAAALALAGSKTKTLGATDLSFSLIPRLNAAGRMGDPSTALGLLATNDPLAAHEVALELEGINQQRRTTEAALTQQAVAGAEAAYEGQRALVLAGEGWHEGVKGIVASRLANRFGVPTVIFSLEGDEARGSGRSVGAVNLFKAVEQCAGLMLRFGGHEGAVGVTVPRDGVDAFRQRLEEVLAREPEENFHPALALDAALRLGDISIPMVDELHTLEPFGQDNREPLFVSCDVFIASARAVGVEKNHLAFAVSDGRHSFDAIWFHCPSPAHYAALGSAVDVVYTLQVDEWNNRRKVKLMVKAVFEKSADTPTLPVEKNRDAPALLTEDLADAALTPNLAHWQSLGARGANTLATELRRALIGEAPLHEAQQQALDYLAAGESVLTVMATGRGKSLIFHLHAARLALTTGQASVFVYPLRALIADQAFHLSETFARFGLAVRTITGETPQQERDAVFSALANGTANVLLTTPEFLQIHAGRFTASGRVGFLVVDEAHHVALSKAGHRPAYAAFEGIRQRFPQATVLAVTATAGDEVCDVLVQDLGLAHVVLDHTVRSNLTLDSQRSLKGREACLATHVAQDGKAVVYVNTRDQSIALTRMLRKRLPAMGERIAFYNAGLPRAQRKQVEEGFRDNRLDCIVSTSAFGEGVNIPNIRQVVLYNLPYSEVEFNQMAGRAGRDGETAAIRLLYDEDDAAINRRILQQGAPPRTALVTLYRALVAAAAAASPPGIIARSNSELVGACKALDQTCTLDETGVLAGIAAFSELGILEVRGFGEDRELVVNKGSKRVELNQSSRYLEGCEELEHFMRFKDWALTATPDELLAKVNRPILPTRPVKDEQ